MPWEFKLVSDFNQHDAFQSNFFKGQINLNVEHWRLIA